MSTHNDRILRTDTICTVQEVICGPQIKHWIEFQLLDEQGEPLANLPWRAVNDATRAACAPECSGESDAEGVIRIEGLHPIPITLQLAANPLAEQLQTRRLRAERA
ncbi:lipase family protein, partial [Pseudomonas gingeri]|nr:lipase family protein [Pseudomonas gingeri]